MIFRIALRNTLRQKRRTILTALTMVGGFVLASISVGWSDGTYSHIINMFTRNQLGHIQVHGKGYLDEPSIYNTITEYDSLGRMIGDMDGVDYWTPRLFSAGLLTLVENSSAVQVTGIDPDLENQATRFDQKIVNGTTLPDTAAKQTVLGKGLAEVLEASVGDTVVIVSQAADGSIANDSYRVSGILETGDQMSDRMTMYLHLRDAQELYVLPNQVHEIALVVENLDDVRPLTDAIQQKLGGSGLSVKPWQEFARSFYQAMQADIQGMWIMIFVIVLIVAIGVLNTVLMSVLERTKEYGVQRAIGTRPKQIFWQVIFEVNTIALASLVIGAILAILANSLLAENGIPLPEAFDYGGMEFKRMYSAVTWDSLYIPALTVLFSALLVSFFPAMRAAQTKPAKAMRTR